MNTGVILHAEDDENDAYFVKRAFALAKLDVILRQVPNGQEAVDYLDGAGPYNDRRAFPPVELLLLDLKMPVLNGFEVLGWVRSQPLFRGLPVFVLSSSEYEEDQQRAKLMGATGYLIKTAGFENVVRIVSNLLCPSGAEHAGQVLEPLHGVDCSHFRDAPGNTISPSGLSSL